MSTLAAGLKKWLSLAITVVLLLVIVGLIRSLIGFSRIRDRFSEAERSVARLEEQKVQMESQLQLQDEAYVAEEQLRNGLGLAREGEAVVIIPEEMLNEAMSKQADELDRASEKPNWRKWVELFL